VVPAQTPLKSFKSPEGGMILYGVADGTTNPASGLVSGAQHEEDISRYGQGFSNYYSETCKLLIFTPQFRVAQPIFA
jgi:hypothetical protein